MPDIIQHLMFDIDGTLTKSCEFDGDCYDEAVYEITGDYLEADRNYYQDVSDEGILRQHFSENHYSDAQSKLLIRKIKHSFIEKITNHLACSPAQEITAARAFLDILRQHPEIQISLATGGWRETALLKLNSAGFNAQDIPLASSNEHYMRTEIMHCARREAEHKNNMPISYFGDGHWDQKACEILGWNFILVGENSFHPQHISDYTNAQKIVNYLPATISL